MTAVPWATDSEGSTEILVHVQPGARRSGFVGLHGDALKVAVRAKATEGEANRAVCELVAGALGVARSSVHLTSGHRSRRKRVRVEGRGSAEVVTAVSRLMSG